MYVDDILIKSRNLDDHLANLKVNSIIMKDNKVWINMAKCAFGVIVGKFQGFMLTEREIEVNPTKCKAMLERCEVPWF